MDATRLAVWFSLFTVPILSAQTHQIPKNTLKVSGHTFNLPDGYTVESALAPKLARFPVNGCFDELGRLYITDVSGSNAKPTDQLKDLPHRILRLESTKGDGVFDKAVEFADKLGFPEGILVHKGSVYVACPPKIWKLTDTDGDGIADKREEWFDGKTLTGCANDLHGPYLGRDGYIYWCKGAFAKQDHTIAGKEFTTRASHVFRAKPDGSGREVVLTGGMDNPVGWTMRSDGEMFLSATFLRHPGGGERDGVVHILPGQIHGKDHDVIRDPSHKWTSPNIAPIMLHLGPAAPSGLLCSQSEVFGKPYRESLYATQFNLRKVSRHVLKESGSTFTTDNEDFLTSDQMDFHPTDVLEDADGSILVIDTGGWYKLCCPTSSFAKPEVGGGIYRIRKKDAPKIDDPRGNKIAWDKLDALGLLALLDDSRFVVRERAFQRLEKFVTEEAFWKVLRKKIPEAETGEGRQLLAWLALRSTCKDAEEYWLDCLNDARPNVRRTALRAIRSTPTLTENLQNAVLKRLASKDPFEQRLAAHALGRSLKNQNDIVKSLLKCAENPDERLHETIIASLLELAQTDTTTKGLESSTASVRRVALVTLHHLQQDQLPSKTVLKGLQSKDKLERETALWIATRTKGHAELVKEYLKTELPKLKPKDYPDIEPVLITFSQTIEGVYLIAFLLQSEESSIELKEFILKIIRESKRAEIPREWVLPLFSLLEKFDSPLRPAVLKTCRQLPTKPVKAFGEMQLIRKYADQLTDSKLKVEYLYALPGTFDSLRKNEHQAIVATLDGEKDAPLRNMAIDVLQRSKLTPDQLNEIAKLLEKVSPLEVDRLLRIFENNADDKVAETLLKSLDRKDLKGVIRPDLLHAPFKKVDAKLREKSAELVNRLVEGVAEQKKNLEALEAKLPAGDAKRGREVFHSKTAQCASCHAVGYVGGKIGPDMTRIGGIRSQRDLLEAVIYPSASLVRSYEPVTISTTQGKTFNGLIKRENADEIVLTLNAEQEARIRREDIDSQRPSLVSIMPAGLEKQLKLQELADLIEFLKSCK